MSEEIHKASESRMMWRVFGPKEEDMMKVRICYVKMLYKSIISTFDRWY
jgi:hypothetical protein